MVGAGACLIGTLRTGSCLLTGAETGCALGKSKPEGRFSSLTGMRRLVCSLALFAIIVLSVRS